MTEQRELDRLLGAFLVDGTDELADRVIDAALDQIDHTHQRRASRLPPRFPTMTMPMRIAAVIAILVIAAGGTYYLTRTTQPSVGVPGPTPSASPSAATASAWSATGSMEEARTDFAATLLRDGRVLVVDGRNLGPLTSPQVLNHTEIYDPATGSWTRAGPTSSRARSFPTATLLATGKVLVVGGIGASMIGATRADLYDPVAGTWGSAGDTVEVRNQHAAVQLADGKILVAGGNPDNTVGTSEVYDPASGTWTATGNMTVSRASETLTLLDDGRVLALGGFINGPDPASAEIYDPATGKWTATTSMSQVRTDGQTATKLANGKVLVTGDASSAAELFDPLTATWAAAGKLPGAMGGQTATTLRDGRILFAGGLGPNDAGLASAEVYDPALGTFTTIDPMPDGRISGRAVLMADGRVLVAGGIDRNSNDGTGALKTVVIYDPALSN